jgi:two-component system C4-dicarboxylate transport sensor histidine kinase DctB
MTLIAGRSSMPPQQRRLTLAALLAVALVVVAGILVSAERYGRRVAVGALDARAAAALPLANAALAGEISKQQLLVAVLAEDSDIGALLAAPDAEKARAIGAKLKALAADAGSSVLYVIGRDGVTVAASNFDAPESFVGSDYGFRTYFSAAMATGRGFQYGLGTVSKRPGLYLSQRVDGPDGPAGVVVVKAELGRVEANWHDSGYTVFASDGAGVVLATSRADWRFATLGPLADPAATRAALQIGEVPMPQLPLRADTDGLMTAPAGSGTVSFAPASGPVGAVAPGWRLTVLIPADAAIASAVRLALFATIAALLLAAGLGVAIERRRRSIRRRQLALSQMNAELERRVAERTAALAAEMEGREAAEGRVRRLRDELAQANRLSILGQIAAGVAHEINQPLAAIRTYVDNAGRLLDAGKGESVRDNLGAIARVTERIGEITGSLRSFARRAAGSAGPVALDDAIDGALALLAGRIRDSGVAITRGKSEGAAVVSASRIRLEQIIVNLLQNALDALKGRTDGRIGITVERAGDRVSLRVADNGSGIAPEIAETLFMPFVTTKEAGLGLGLVISAEIARELGGTLRHDAEAGPGTVFVLELPCAP